ncbi:MAG: rhomboid family intramembrane serine protease [Rhodobacteraceae bacterium]|nr:rhomboid family intramembrane serine protease [Paracoccaceae bacterium]
MNPLPLVVWILILPVAAMEIVLSLADAGLVGGPAGIGWRNDALQRFALSPEMLDRMIAANEWPRDYLQRFLTYPVVHGGFVHAMFTIVFLAAIGKMVGEVFRAWAVLAVFFGATVAGGLAYSLIPGIRYALYGAYPGVYGLIGALTFILWARLAAQNANRYRAFTLIGTLMLIQLVFAIFFGANPHWTADVTGFAAGFGLSFLVGPGGPAHLLQRIRQR